MNVLIVSHNVLGGSTGMGRTLATYFSEIDNIKVHQFYIHSEIPVADTVCMDYYRFTDSDALKSHIPFVNTGTVFERKDIRRDLEFSRTDHGLVGNVYQYGRKRTPGIYLLRNLLWNTAHWDSRKLREWVKEVAPDVVFFAAGDYAFTYKIAVNIADYADCALVVLCTDDYFLRDNKPERQSETGNPFRGRKISCNTILKEISKKQFMSTVHRTMKRAECILCMCDEMRDRYRDLFKKKTYTIYTGAVEKDVPLNSKEKNKISYVGYLGGNRHKSLIELGDAISKLNPECGPDAIEVYSNEKRPQIVSELQECPGIRFHGEADPGKAAEVIADSEYVVHIEGFDPESRKAVRYSISTKIADYLMNGPCIIAYGPEEVASMRYLSDNKAAVVITSKELLGKKLKEIFADHEQSKEIVNKARVLAHKNHEMKKVGARINKILRQAADVYFGKQKGGCI